MALLTYMLYAGACLALYGIVVSYKTHRRLKQFKGPFLASITDLWLFKQSLNHRMHYKQKDLLDQHGSLARIGPNLLVTSDPDVLRHMSAPRSPWSRGEWYTPFSLGKKPNSLFSERDDKIHSRLRGKLGPAYSGRTVHNLESCIAAQIGKMHTLLRTQYIAKGRQVDVARLSQYFTLDVLSEIAFGHAFGYLEADQDLWSYISLAESFLPILELCLNHAWFYGILFSRPVAALLAPKEGDKTGMGALLDIANKATEKRYDQTDRQQGKADMLGHFLAQGLSQAQAQNEGFVQILAGSDSTSTTFRMGMLYIVTNPRVYNALRAEIDSGISDGSISADSPITDQEARLLPYLQAIIWETLRMCPPLFGLQNKLAPPQGDTINGVYFPGGTQVATCPVALCRRKDIFGSDADVFRPERWIEEDEATRAKYLSTVELIFGSGRYGCLGRNIAMLELNKVFVELFRRFDWSIANPITPVKVNYAHSAWIHKGMNMVVTERKQQ